MAKTCYIRSRNIDGIIAAARAFFERHHFTMSGPSLSTRKLRIEGRVGSQRVEARDLPEAADAGELRPSSSALPYTSLVLMSRCLQPGSLVAKA